MGYLLTKYAITAAIVVAVSEFAKRSDRLGALVASLPLVTLLTLIWLYAEKARRTRRRSWLTDAWYTFWYVIPNVDRMLPRFNGCCSVSALPARSRSFIAGNWR